jgi:hypothetical protein
MNELYQKGIDFLKEGSIEDEKKNYHQALGLYTKGLEHILAGMKYDKSKNTRSMMEKKCHEFFERAELLKKHLQEKEKLDQQKEPPKPQGSAKQETEKDKYDSTCCKQFNLSQRKSRITCFLRKCHCERKTKRKMGRCSRT